MFAFLFAQTRINAINSNIRLRSHITSQRILWRFIVLSPGRQSVDQTNARVGIPDTVLCVRHRIFHQFHRHLLSCIACHSVRYNGGGHMHLHLCHSTVDLDWYSGRAQFGWSTGFSVSCECCTATDTGKEMVHGAVFHCAAGWCAAVWIDFH